MTTVLIAAQDTSPDEKSGADVVCTGKDDVAVVAKAFAVRAGRSSYRPARST